MSSSYFNVFEHTIPCQHLREYPRSTRTRQEDVLQLAIKQYEPIHRNDLQDNAVTIIATHANGFVKVGSGLVHLETSPHIGISCLSLFIPQRN